MPGNCRLWKWRLARLWAMEATGTMRGGGAPGRARAARSLADDPELLTAIDRLAAAPGRAVVGLGDSITDDSNGWFEILRGVVALRRPEAGLLFVNAGVSGETTAEMLARMPAVAAADPAWIICLAGVNNGRRFGAMPGPQFSVGETLAGLRLLPRCSTFAGSSASRWTVRCCSMTGCIRTSRGRRGSRARSCGCWR